MPSLRLLLPLCLVLLAGCDVAAPEGPPLEGRYAGEFVYRVDGATFTEPWVLDLRADGGRVTGSGRLGTTPVTVQGEHRHPGVTLQFLDTARTFAGRFAGTLSSDGQTLEGAFDFSIIFVEATVVLRRSP